MATFSRQRGHSASGAFAGISASHVGQGRVRFMSHLGVRATRIYSEHRERLRVKEALATEARRHRGRTEKTEQSRTHLLVFSVHPRCLCASAANAFLPT